MERLPLRRDARKARCMSVREGPLKFLLYRPGRN